MFETTAGMMRRMDADRAMQCTRESMLLALQGAEAALRLGAGGRRFCRNRPAAGPRRNRARQGQPAMTAIDRTPAGPQYVIPGAERVREGTLAQRRADAPLRPKVPQRPAAGLFSDDAAQAGPSPIDRPQLKPWAGGANRRPILPSIRIASADTVRTQLVLRTWVSGFLI
jgi:hypothetical protein